MGLPPDREGRRWHLPIGLVPRSLSRTMNGKRPYGKVEGANLLDWPIDAAEMAPWYEKAETKLGTLRALATVRACRGTTTSRFSRRAPRRSAIPRSTGRMAINSRDYDDRMACQQTGFCFQGAAIRAQKMVGRLYRHSAGRGDRQS